jgi:beta-galactosidase
MTSENEPADSLSRRSLLGRAVGAAGILSALESTGEAGAPTPSAGAGRIRDSFDFGWKFFMGDAPGAREPAFADASWKDVDLPYDWSIEGPLSESAARGQGRSLPAGIGWYRKRFSIPESYRTRKVVIEFDGVYQLSEVWINGQYLGRRPNGYVSFSYDLTPHLKYGGDNVIAVKADNSHRPNSRWYTGSGVYRHTWLLVTNQVHVAHWGTFVTTPQVDADAAIVQIKTRVQNDGKGAAECVVTSAVLDRDGNPIQPAQASASQSVAANGEAEFVQQVRVAKPNLWSIDNPYLYKVRNSVMERGRVVDAYDTVVGIRRAEFDADRGFLLNGKPVKLNGMNIHHDCGSVGTAVPERVWERRLELLKAMGCNAIRTAHNPYAPEFMDLCDKLGFLVMNEMFDEWRQNKNPGGYGLYFDEWSERDVTSFVRRDRNHPSVVLWSAGNEIGEQVSTDGVETLRRLVGIFHKEDPTRPVTMGCDRIAANLGGREVGTPPEFLALLDVAGYNYSDRRRERAEKAYSDDRHAFPARKFVGTENEVMGGVRGDYSELVPPGPGIPSSTGDATPELPRALSPNHRGTAIEQLVKFTRIYNYASGDFLWSGFDYVRESGWPTTPSGVMDACGFPKEGYYFCQSQWTDKPMIHLFPHWTWKGKEGKVIPVLCYTNCDTVELFVNGEPFGLQGYWFPRIGYWPRQSVGRSTAPRTTSDLHLAWTVPYQPGTLKAVGTKDGKVVLEVEVATAGEPAAIELTVDRNAIAADRRDVAHFTVRILDAQGRVVPVADNDVSFEIQGEGKIIGVDNGDVMSVESFKGNRRKAFNGLCLAIVQSTVKPGRIQMTATSPGLKSSSVTVTTSETRGLA